MKILFLFLLAVPTILFAQTSTTNYRIVYSHKIKTESLSIPGQKTIVIHNGNTSLSWNDLNTVSNDPELLKKMSIDRSQKYYSVFKDFTDNLIVFEFRDALLPRSKYMFVDSLNAMSWTIVGTDSTIDSLKCILATCTFRGRDYRAWFAPEIPLQQGPWKFGGLPGLIVSVEDVSSRYSWVLLSFTKSEDKVPELPVTQGNYADFANYMSTAVKKLQESFKASKSTVDPNCIDCGQNTTINVETIEVF